MNLTPYQIVAPLVSVIAVFYAWSLWVRQKKTLWEVLLWTLFWGFVVGISLYPETLSYLQVVTGIKGQVNAILVTSIGVLFFTVFYLVVRLEELEQRQTRMVRKIALHDAGLGKGEKVRS